MIIGALTLLLLHGGNPDAKWIGLALEQVSKSVKDPDREKAAKAILVQAREELEAHAQRVLEIRRELDAVQTNYKSSAADYRALLDRIVHAGEESQTRLTHLRSELLKHVTREEWNDLNTRVQAKIDKARAKAAKKKK